MHKQPITHTHARTHTLLSNTSTQIALC